MKTLGIIDIGSNSIKLIIVEINNNSYREVFHKKFQTRLSEFVGKGEIQYVVTFCLLNYQEAARRWESMIPTLQIYLPIALCQLSDYNRALKLLACMQKRPEEEAYYLVWEAEALRQTKQWDALKETLFQLRKAIPRLPKSRQDEMQKKYEAYERIWREKGES